MFRRNKYFAQGAIAIAEEFYMDTFPNEISVIFKSADRFWHFL